MDVAENIKKAKKILTAPKIFFKAQVKEKGWRLAFAYLIVISAIGHILTVLYNLAFPPNLNSDIKEMLGTQDISYSPSQIVMAILISFIVTLGMSFVWASALKVWLSLFKTESTFDQSYRVIAYSRTPYLLFSWVPYVNILAGIYSFYLMMISIEREYSLPRRKSIVIILTAFILVFIFTGFLLSILPSI